MAQITSVTSEVLQAEIRRLLPSQQGFGEDLQASNVILPIIDLTAAAEGTNVPLLLQNAFAFGSQTAFNVSGSSTTTVINTTGFYRVFAGLTVRTDSSDVFVAFNISDGSSSKTIYSLHHHGGSTQIGVSESVDFVVFLGAGDSFIVQTNSNNATCRGSTRQIADVNGNLINPSGFIPT